MQLLKEILTWLCFVAFAYLSGSVMFSRIIPLLVCKKDVCESSPDGNPGAANAFAACGIPIGMLCLLLDMAKGFLPVFLTYFVFGMDYRSFWFALVLAAPVLGHATAPLYHFRGGKCISTAFGVLIAILPISVSGWILAVVYVLFSTVIKISPNRRRSIAAFGVFATIAVPIALWQRLFSIALGCLVIALTAIYRHTKRFEKPQEVTQ